MKKALVIHTSLSGLGGAEKVSLTIIETLKKMNYYVKLYTLEPTNWERLLRVFRVGIQCLPHEYCELLPFHIRKFTIYTRLIASKIMDLKIKKKFDVIVNTHGGGLPLATDVVYMHFPSFVAEEFYPYENTGLGALINKIYLTGYALLRKYLLPEFNSSRVLCNSNFTKAIIKLKLGIKAEVIYPPINVKLFEKAYIEKTGNEPYNVVTIGRFTPEKNYEFIIEVARKMKDVKFFIVGSINDQKKKKYFKKVLALRNKYKLTNVTIIPNIGDKKLLKLLSKSRVLMHAMKYEHFGMVIAEGMVAGLIPVIHRSGGAYYDIIKRDRYGYSYRNIDEAVDALWKALNNYPKLYGKIHDYASKEFNKEKFIEKFKRVVESLAV